MKHSKAEASTAQQKAYWHAVLKLVFGCLGAWFLVSFGFGILLADTLNQFRLGVRNSR